MKLSCLIISIFLASAVVNSFGTPMDHPNVEMPKQLTEMPKYEVSWCGPISDMIVQNSIRLVDHIPNSQLGMEYYMDDNGNVSNRRVINAQTQEPIIQENSM